MITDSAANVYPFPSRSEVQPKATPFLKWLGGKRLLVDQIASYLAEYSASRLIEPFVGSAAVFLGMSLPRAILADANSDLIYLYKFLSTSRRQQFISECEELFTPDNNKKSSYLKLRDEFNSTRIGTRRRAALFVYLNRHGFNGLCRYNSNGGFNVPFGKYGKPYFPFEQMKAFSDRLVAGDVSLLHSDFKATIDLAGDGDIVYCDPPYIPVSKTSNFTAYSSGGFSLLDQQSLALEARMASERGALVIISNSDSDLTREVYANASEIHALKVSRTISCKSESRKPAGEVFAVYRPASDRVALRMKAGVVRYAVR